MLKQTSLAALVLLACFVALMKGFPTSSRDRCLCKRRAMMSVNMDHVASVEYHQSSSSCGREELVVTLKSNLCVNGCEHWRRCVNLRGKQGRRIKEAIMNERNVK